MLHKLLVLFVLFPAMALASSFVEGKEYQMLTNPQTSASKNNLPVIQEFFSYGCPWCYKIEGTLSAWRANKGKAIQFRRVPVVFKTSWELYAKAYYVAKILDISDKINPLLFKSIQDEKNLLDSKQAMIDFFVAQGVDQEIVKSAFEHSPTIDTHVHNAMNLMGTYQINAVPAFVVNHKYKTDLEMAGSPERLLEIVDYLSGKS